MHSNHYVTRRPAALAICRLLLLAIAQLPLISAAPTLQAREPEAKPPDDPSLWLYLGVATALVLSGGAFAGLTIALMGQDEIYLQVIQTSGEGSEKKNAATVLNLLKKGKHWVLVTLLLSNVITNETLPIVLDRSLGGGWPAVLGSTVLIVIFGEIVPQSICVRYGLPIGAWMAPGVLTLMYLMSPVAWPIAKLLDRLLGEDHGTIYKKAGLKTLVTLHKNLGQAGEQLNSDEVTIISAVLDLKEKPVGNIMIPMEDVFTMSVDDVLDEKTMDLILSQGYSRIPIHAADNEYNFVGMLLVKMLITYDPEDCKLVRDFALATLPETRAETSCLDIVNFFQEGKSHMVLVSEYPGEDHGALGVVTLEDVIEELIGEEIIDESDVFIDVHKAIRRMTPAPKSRVPKGKIVAEPPDIPNPVQAPLNEISNDSSISRSSQTESRETPQQRTPTARYNSPPQPTFYLRKSRTFDSREGSESSIVKRGPTPEIREHLKHLGPSNLASRPRQTRYHSVKIKPGNTSPTRFSSTPNGLDSARPSSPESRRASETASLLGAQAQSKIPAGGKAARGGVRALKASYGTLGDRAMRSSPGPTALPESTTEAVSRATSTQDEGERLEPTPKRKHHQHRPSGTISPHVLENSRGSSPAAESVKSNISPAQTYRLHGPTRSGSITEQIIDANGIKKVILQTGSGSASEDENGNMTRKGDASPTPGHSGRFSRGRRTSREEDEHGEEGGPSSKNLHQQAQTPKKKSRRKRRGNKHGGGSKPPTSAPNEESRPLLDGYS